MNNILKINVTSLSDLAKIYVRQFKFGGVFVGGKFDFGLGDEVFLIISLPENSEPCAVGGRVCWIAPASAVGYPEGIGVQFNNDKAGTDAKSRLEIILGGLLQKATGNFTF